MEQTVYADILFLINFSMDFLCFYITAKLLHRKLPKLRALLSSIFGGVYSVVILFAGFSPPLELVVDIFAWFIMCVTVFASKKLSFAKLMLSSLTYVGVSVALGGIMTASFNMINLLGFKADALRDSGDGMPVWLFALLAAVSGAATLMGGNFFRKKQAERTADIEITYGGKTVKLTALCDSGNLVRDPISGKSVVVADIFPLASALPDEIIRAVKRRDASALAKLSPDTAKNLRFVPSRTATGFGMLYALAPERMTVSPVGEKPYDVDALIAPIQLGASARGFQALIPPELLV